MGSYALLYVFAGREVADNKSITELNLACVKPALLNDDQHYACSENTTMYHVR